LAWYALRWKIEVFHKILKSGCKAEESKLRTAERLVKLLSVFCILAWRIFRADDDQSLSPPTHPPDSP
jgi:IS4 transposase